MFFTFISDLQGIQGPNKVTVVETVAVKDIQHTYVKICNIHYVIILILFSVCVNLYTPSLGKKNHYLHVF